MSICSEISAQMKQEQIITVEISLCDNITNTTVSFCTGHQADANSGNVQYELCAELCADGLEAALGWSNCNFGPTPGPTPV